MLSLLLAISLSTVAPEQPGSHSYLLLQNGEVLYGDITKIGDRYLVSLGDGAELRIAAQQVDMHCLDLDEAYRRKRDLIREGDAEAHLRLADWCLRNKQLARAADELLVVTALAPRHPHLPLMERRLNSAVNRPPPRITKTTDRRVLVSLDELERTTRELPTESVETFSARVQRLLLNRCGANCCHGSRSEAEMRLTRASTGRALTRRFTQRNLHAVLQQIDLQHPEQSRLLQEPLEAHGGLPGPVFSKREQEQYALLAKWVRTLALAKHVPHVERIDTPASALMQASYEQPIPFPSVGERAATDSIGRLDPLRSGRNGQRMLVDPFDPAYFNQYFVRDNEVSPAETVPPARHRETADYSTAVREPGAFHPPSTIVPTPLPPDSAKLPARSRVPSATTPAIRPNP